MEGGSLVNRVTKQMKVDSGWRQMEGNMVGGSWRVTRLEVVGGNLVGGSWRVTRLEAFGG